MEKTMNSVVTVQLLKMLKTEHTLQEMSDATGFSYGAVARWVRKMRAAKAIHVSGYAVDAVGREITQKFLAGEGVDAPRPAKQRTDAERMRIYRSKRAEREKGQAA